MTIPIPVIDDRKFKDLMAEAVSLIPRYNKEWTNYNPSDPGIALLEIFAWVSESVMYRADKVTEDNFWKFLKLIGELRKRTTSFQQEFEEGSIFIAGGEMQIISSITSDSLMTLFNGLERDLDRPTELTGILPDHRCPTPVLIDGKIIRNIEPVFFESLAVGNIIIAGKREISIVQAKVDTDADKYIEVHLPFSSSLSGADREISAITTKVPDLPVEYDPAEVGPVNKVRVRGRHVLGDFTDFKSKLQMGDVIVAGPWARVIADIPSKNSLTVHVPFEEDIDDAVDYFYVESEVRSGTVITEGTKVIGNDADEDLEEAKLRAITYVTEPYRAVTVADYEHFAARAMDEIVGDDESYRIVCLNNRNHEWTAIGTERPGHVTIFLVVHSADRYLQGQDKSKKLFSEVDEMVFEAMEQGVNEGLLLSINEAFQQGVANGLQQSGDASQVPLYEKVVLEIIKLRLISFVESELDPRRILTTRVHAVFPEFKKVAIEASLFLVKGVNEETVRDDAESKLKEFLDPISGGPQADGWPLGRNLYRSEVYQVLESIDGVDHVHELTIKTGDELDEVAQRHVELDENEFFELTCSVTIKRA